MSNLGSYQNMVELAKKVGGPIILGILTAIAGYVGSKTIEASIKFVKNKSEYDDGAIYEVTDAYEINDEIKLNVGDKFKVIGGHLNSLLVELLGKNNNPYVMDKQTLVRVSNYS